MLKIVTYYNYANRILPFKKIKDKLLIFGSTDSTCGLNHPGLYKPIIRVVDTNGILSQTKLYLSTNKYRNICNVDTTKDKGYIVCYSQSETYSGRTYLMTLDSNLNLVWNKMYDTSNTVVAGITTLKSGKYVLANTHVDSSYTSSFFWERITLTKLDENGNIIWRKLYGIKDLGPAAMSVKELSNKDLVVCGNRQITYSSSVGQLVGFIMRTDSMGNLKWWKNYIPTSPIKDTAGQCYLYDIVEMPDKGLAAVGFAAGDSGLGTIEQTWLLRVDSMGCLNPGCPSGVGIEEINNVTSNNIRIYPNPANTFITIETEAAQENKQIRIMNALGQEIISEKIISSLQKISIENLSNGMYYLRVLEKDRPVFIQKIIKE